MLIYFASHLNFVFKGFLDKEVFFSSWPLLGSFFVLCLRFLKALFSCGFSFRQSSGLTFDLKKNLSSVLQIFFSFTVFLPLQLFFFFLNNLKEYEIA